MQALPGSYKHCQGHVSTVGTRGPCNHCWGPCNHFQSETPALTSSKVGQNEDDQDRYLHNYIVYFNIHSSPPPGPVPGFIFTYGKFSCTLYVGCPQVGHTSASSANS